MQLASFLQVISSVAATCVFRCVCCLLLLYFSAFKFQSMSKAKSMPQLTDMKRIHVMLGDITEFIGDAIVNAANERLLGGGGVDGAIHRAAGRGLYGACLEIPEVRPGVRCPTGEARITSGFDLPARHVIHTVGPVYRDGKHGEPEQLASCYRNALALAAANGCTTIAFPSISTGVYGYPVEEAAAIAVREVRAAIARNPNLEVTFVCFNGPRDKTDVAAVYNRILQNK